MFAYSHKPVLVDSNMVILYGEDGNPNLVIHLNELGVKQYSGGEHKWFAHKHISLITSYEAFLEIQSW